MEEHVEILVMESLGAIAQLVSMELTAKQVKFMHAQFILHTHLSSILFNYGENYCCLVNSQLRLSHFKLFDWLKISDYEPIVGVLRHMENSAPSLTIFRFVKLWK